MYLWLHYPIHLPGGGAHAWFGGQGQNQAAVRNTLSGEGADNALAFGRQSRSDGVFSKKLNSMEIFLVSVTPYFWNMLFSEVNISS